MATTMQTLARGPDSQPESLGHPGPPKQMLEFQTADDNTKIRIANCEQQRHSSLLPLLHFFRRQKVCTDGVLGWRGYAPQNTISANFVPPEYSEVTSCGRQGACTNFEGTPDRIASCHKLREVARNCRKVVLNSEGTGSPHRC